jgi:hypothetical protein
MDLGIEHPHEWTRCSGFENDGQLVAPGDQLPMALVSGEIDC